MDAEKANDSKGSILSGPSLEELIEACSGNLPVVFKADNKSGELNVLVQSLKDMKHPSVNRWMIHVKTVDGNFPLVIYYTIPERRGLYGF